MFFFAIILPLFLHVDGQSNQSSPRSMPPPSLSQQQQQQQQQQGRTLTLMMPPRGGYRSPAGAAGAPNSSAYYHHQQQQQQHDQQSDSDFTDSELSTPPYTPTPGQLPRKASFDSSRHSSNDSSRANSPVPSAVTDRDFSPKFGGGAKHRQLPCRTWISTGCCPYTDRCVFLHDPRVMAKQVAFKTKRKSKEDGVTDGLFWPTLSKEHINMRLDSRGQPAINQYYIVPSPLDEKRGICLPPPAVLGHDRDDRLVYYYTRYVLYIYFWFLRI